VVATHSYSRQIVPRKEPGGVHAITEPDGRAELRRGRGLVAIR